MSTGEIKNLAVRYSPYEIRYFFAEVPEGTKYVDNLYNLRQDLPTGKLNPGQIFNFPGTAKASAGYKMCMILQDDSKRTEEICDLSDANINFPAVCPVCPTCPPIVPCPPPCPDIIDPNGSSSQSKSGDNKDSPTQNDHPQRSECTVSDVPWWLWLLIAVLVATSIGGIGGTIYLSNRKK